MQLLPGKIPLSAEKEEGQARPRPRLPGRRGVPAGGALAGKALPSGLRKGDVTRHTKPGQKAFKAFDRARRVRFLILISNKMLYLKSRVFHTLVPHVPCDTPSHKNLTRLAL